MAWQDDDEPWAANPWQERADAHMTELQRRMGHAHGSNPTAAAAGSSSVSFPFGALASQRDAVLHSSDALQATMFAQRHCRELANQPSGNASHLSEPQQHSYRLCGGDSSNQVTELARKNEFLSALVGRHVKRIADLEAEIVNLTLLGSPPAGCSDRGSLASDNYDGGFSAGGVNATQRRSVKDADEILNLKCRYEDRIRDLEVEVAEKQQQMGAETCAVKPLLEFEVQLEDVLRRNAYLENLTSCLEESASKMRANVETCTEVMHCAEAKCEHEHVCVGELRARSLDVGKQLCHASEATLELHVLRTGLCEAEQSLESNQESAQSAQFELRTCRRDHNRELQELKRRMQTVEKNQKHLEIDKRRCSSEVEAMRRERSAAQVEYTQEICELRSLNAQLVERLQEERSSHAEIGTSHDNYVHANHLDCAEELQTSGVELESHCPINHSQGRRGERMTKVVVGTMCKGSSGGIKRLLSKVQGVISVDCDIETRQVVVKGNALEAELLEKLKRWSSASLTTVDLIESVDC